MKSSLSEYYDQNTRRFLRFAPKGSGSTIHRAIWAPGVVNRTQAVNHVHDLILTHGVTTPEPIIAWDLGCGVGATMIYLAQKLPGIYRGLTISSVQQNLAQQNFRNLPEKSSKTLTVNQGSYCDSQSLLALELEGKPSLIYMIESFVHGSCSNQLFHTLAQQLVPGGRLVICDDMLAYAEAIDDPWVKRFIRGWHISSLFTPDQIVNRAKDSDLDLITNINLTPYIELNRPRDKVIRAIMNLAEKLPSISKILNQTPFWLNMFGGDGLQQGTMKGLLEYRLLVFEKPRDLSPRNQ